jgi:glycosyltransferase, family 1
MNDVCIIGHFAEGKECLDGQTVKTKTVYNELTKENLNLNIAKIDTFEWRKHPVKLLLVTCHQYFKSKNIIIMLSRNGMKFFSPILYFLQKIRKKRIHHVVIGGNLPELLEHNRSWKKYIKAFYCNYVETKKMMNDLQKMSIDNVVVMPNFKEIKRVAKNEKKENLSVPFRLCTFSRVMKEKGIEDAVTAVKSINDKHQKIIYTLDIYGQIDESYKLRFNELINEFPSYIQYKGTVPYDCSVSILKDYFLLLFPTYFYGEGFAGTILDAFAAGVPVIATNWKHNGEIITDKQNGFLYDTEQKERLRELLIECYQNPQIINDMREACLKCADAYSPDKVMKILIENLQK